MHRKLSIVNTDRAAFGRVGGAVARLHGDSGFAGTLSFDLEVDHWSRCQFLRDHSSSCAAFRSSACAAFGPWLVTTILFSFETQLTLPCDVPCMQQSQPSLDPGIWHLIDLKGQQPRGSLRCCAGKCRAVICMLPGGGHQAAPCGRGQRLRGQGHGRRRGGHHSASRLALQG